MHIWRSEDNFQELVLFFHRVGSGDWTWLSVLAGSARSCSAISHSPMVSLYLVRISLEDPCHSIDTLRVLGRGGLNAGGRGVEGKTRIDPGLATSVKFLEVQ